MILPDSTCIVIAAEHMATTFRVHVRGWEATRARQVAQEVFREIARLENVLSRYVPGSDIDQLNLAPPGEAVRLNADACACLRIALDVAAATDGAFDPTVGIATGDPRAAGRSDAHPRPSYLDLTLDPASMTASRRHEHVRLDLGGIGKGYALDCAVEILREWEVPSALLDAGGSTVLAVTGQPGVPPWLARLECSHHLFTCELATHALASSGIMEKGNHIVDPHTGIPAAGRKRIWAMAPTAAEADALSTAFFVLSEPAILACCRDSTTIGAAWEAADLHGLVEVGALRSRADDHAARITRLSRVSRSADGG